MRRRMKEVLPLVVGVVMVWLRGVGSGEERRGDPTVVYTYTHEMVRIQKKKRTTALPPSTMIFLTISFGREPRIAPAGGSMMGGWLDFLDSY